MSEYQYYRFECLDGHLECKQREALRKISSRAEITASSFQVNYHYSDLKAEPCEVVLKHFDIGFYYANWGSISVYIKLPLGTIPDALLELEVYGFDVQKTQKWQLLVFSIEEHHEYFDDEDSEDFFQHLAGLRNELLQGDWRILYFMWLAELDANDELAAIPMINFDFSHLSDAQSAFAYLFDTPLALVKALALALVSKPSHRPKLSQFQLEDWLNNLTAADKNNLLRAVFEQGQLTPYQALAMTKQERTNKEEAYQYWLTLQVIEPYIEQAQTQLQQEQAEALAKELAIEKAQKEKMLLEIYSQREHFWQQAQEKANQTSASGYNQASRFLHQLFDAYQFKDNVLEFSRRFKEFITVNNGRKALLKRLDDILL